MVSALFLLAATAPHVLSADYCADQLVLALADRQQIAALSVDAEKDFSYLREEARELPQARADAEEVMARRADVVLRFWGGDAHRLSRLGVKVVTLDYASDFDGVRSNIRKAAAAIDQQARGEALVAHMNARLDALHAKGPSGKSAIYVTPGGVTAGAHTMINAIFEAAGVGNIAAEKGLFYWPAFSIEEFLLEPPSIVVTGFYDAQSERANHWSAARHPAMKAALQLTTTVNLAAGVLACPGWFSLDAAEAIRRTVDEGNENND